MLRATTVAIAHVLGGTIPAGQLHGSAAVVPGSWRERNFGRIVAPYALVRRSTCRTWVPAAKACTWPSGSSESGTTAPKPPGSEGLDSRAPAGTAITRTKGGQDHGADRSAWSSRDAVLCCSTATFNTTNGISLTWDP